MADPGPGRPDRPRSRLWSWRRNPVAMLVLTVMALLGPALILLGQTAWTRGHQYATEGTVVATGTGTVTSCHRVGPVGSDGFGRSWHCAVRVTWTADSRSLPGNPPATTTVTVKNGQLSPDRVGSTVTVERRLVPKGAGRTPDTGYVVQPAPTPDETTVLLGNVLFALGVLVAVGPFGYLVLRVVTAVGRLAGRRV